MAYLKSDMSPEVTGNWALVNLMARKRGVRRSEARRPRSHEIEGLEGNEYPLLPSPDAVVFPNMVTPLFLGRDRSVRAVEAAEAMHVPLLVAAQRDPEMQDPDLSDLYTIGTAVEIGRVLRIQSGEMRTKRRQRAEEKAQQVPVRMMIPLVLFILPCLFLVIMGPAGIQMAETFGNQ